MNVSKYLLGGILLFSFATPSYAASWLECNGDSGKKIRWGGNTPTARINTGSFSGSVLTAARRGIDAVNRNPSPFSINDVTETGGVGSGNGQNEVYGQSISPPGVARMRYHCYWFFGWHHGLDEVDVVLDTTPGSAWTSSESKSSNLAYTGTRAPIDAVIAHEAGHYAGLMHVNWEYNIMGDSWRHHHTNGSTARTYFGEDASHGARVLYGTQGSTFNDVSASHWRRTGASGEYSTHGRTRVRNAANNGNQPAVMINGEVGYRVNRGQFVRPEFTIENNGKQSHSNVSYGIYVSTNDYISYSDQRIGGGTFGNVHPADVFTSAIGVTIPNNLNPGQNYWIGIIVDENNTINEVSGSNNRAYIPIRVQ